MDHAARVDVDDAVPVVEQEFLGLAPDTDAGIVEHEIEPAVAAVCLVDELGDIVRVPDVDLCGLCAGPCSVSRQAS